MRPSVDRITPADEGFTLFDIGNPPCLKDRGPRLAEIAADEES
ncbi:hypothetical protein [Micromonospora sp. NPDC047527]